MPLIRLALTARRHSRVWRLIAGVVVMALLFAMLLSAVEPAHGHQSAPPTAGAGAPSERSPIRPDPAPGTP